MGVHRGGMNHSEIWRERYEALLRWVKKTSPSITEATPEDWKDFWYSPEANGTWGITEEKEVSPELQVHLDRIKHLEEEITKYKQEISILKIYLEGRGYDI